MKITYDSEVDVAYIMLVEKIEDGEVEETRRFEINSEVNFDIDSHGNILGIEILDASDSLRSEMLSQAVDL